MAGVEPCPCGFPRSTNAGLSMMSSTLARGTTTEMPVLNGSCAHPPIPSGSFSAVGKNPWTRPMRYVLPGRDPPAVGHLPVSALVPSVNG